MSLHTHQLNIPTHLSQSKLPAQIANVASVKNVNSQSPSQEIEKRSPHPANDLRRSQENGGGAASNKKNNQNSYANGYNKKSTADLIRARLNIPSSKKKQSGFSHSDEMQYKRQTGLKDFQII